MVLLKTLRVLPVAEHLPQCKSYLPMKIAKLYISVTCVLKGLWTIGLQWSTICSSSVRYVERSIGIAPAFHVTELNIELIRTNLAWNSLVQKVAGLMDKLMCWLKTVFTNHEMKMATSSHLTMCCVQTLVSSTKTCYTYYVHGILRQWCKTIWDV